MVRFKPKKYRTQPFYRYCGVFQIITILESRLGVHKSPREVFAGFTKLTGFTLPTQIAKKFNELGLPAVLLNKDDYTLESLKHNLDKDKNIILLTGHGYNSKGNSFNIMKAFFAQHYISIWGYDEVKKGFYIYDSSVKQGHAHKDLPIGNMFLPEYIMKKALAWAGWGMMDNVIITV